MANNQEFRYDFFISYSHFDQEWVRNWLLPELEKTGLHGCVDFRDFEIGATALDNMENAVNCSRHTIIVLTPEWVESEWTNFEASIAHTADPANRRRTLIPILLRACEIPARINLTTYANFKDRQRWESELQRVIAAVRDKRSLAESGPTQPAQPKDMDHSQNIDSEHPLFSINNRLGTLSQKENIPIVCIGSVYVDIVIQDIELDENLRHSLDFSREVPVNLDIQPGGSIYYVARYLKELNRDPLIVSYVGDGNINGFANIFFELAARDKIRTAVQAITRKKGAATAVTVHFVDSKQGRTAMYTDRGLLKNFGWRQALEILQKWKSEQNQSYDNGAIYIAGFFKTSLDDRLHENLKELHKNGSIIFLDHGRLEPDQGKDAKVRISNLAEALQLVDVYFSTKEELAQLIGEIATLGLTSQPLYKSESIQELIDQIIKDGRISLPPIMLIKDKTGRPRVHKVGVRSARGGYEWRDIRVAGRSLPMKKRYIVGSSNAFNAAFIDAFLRIRNEINIETIVECAEQAQRRMVKAEVEG